MDKKPFRKTSKIPGNKNRGIKNILFAVLIIFFGMAIFSGLNQPSKLENVPLNDVINRANNDEIKTITVKGDELTITKKGEDKPSQESRKENGSSLYEQGLTNRNVEVNVKSASDGTATWTNIGISLLPVLLIGF